MYRIAGFFWWVHVYNFGPFWQFANSPKLKSPNLDTFYINFTDKHVVFGDYFFHIFFYVSMIKRDYCYMHTVLQIQGMSILLKINAKLM